MRNKSNWEENHGRFALSWFEWSKWLYELQERRLEKLKATAVFAVTANVATLQVFDGLTRGINFKSYSWLNLAIALTVLSIFLVTWALLPKKVISINLAEVRTEWNDFLNNQEPERQPYGLTEHLQLGKSDSKIPNPIQSLQQYATFTSKLVTISLVLNSVSVVIALITGGD